MLPIIYYDVLFFLINKFIPTSLALSIRRSCSQILHADMETKRRKIYSIWSVSLKHKHSFFSKYEIFLRPSFARKKTFKFKILIKKLLGSDFSFLLRKIVKN